MATMVKLYSKELNKSVEHDIEHANRIFAYNHNHGWELKDNNFILNDGVIERTSTGADSKAAKQGADKHSDTPRG